MVLHDSNRQALRTLQDIVGILRRASYAGPMRDASGHPTDRVWLAVPYFDGTRLQGMHVAALSMQQAVDVLLPPWFLESQTVRLVVDDAAPPPDAGHEYAERYRQYLSLPAAERPAVPDVELLRAGSAATRARQLLTATGWQTQQRTVCRGGCQRAEAEQEGTR